MTTALGKACDFGREQRRLGPAVVVILILFAGLSLFKPAVAADPIHSPTCPVIAMITWRGITEAEQGFVDGLTQSGRPMSLLWRHADQDLDRLAEIIRELKANPVDLIYVFGTIATQTVLQEITDTPVVFNIVTQPLAAGIIQGWEHSGNNAVGASNQVPVENQLKALKKVVPFQHLGIIYNPGEPNSLIQRDLAFQLQESMGFDLRDFQIVTPDYVPQVLPALKGSVDAVFIPADSLMITLGDDLASYINEFHLPSLVTVSSMVKEHGLLMGLMPSYYELGLLASQKAERILHGEAPTDIPSSHLEFFQITLNMKTAQKIDVQIPMAILVIANQIVR